MEALVAPVRLVGPLSMERPLGGRRTSALDPACVKTRTKLIETNYSYKLTPLHRGFPGLWRLTRHEVASRSGSSAFSHSLGRACVKTQTTLAAANYLYKFTPRYRRFRGQTGLARHKITQMSSPSAFSQGSVRLGSSGLPGEDLLTARDQTFLASFRAVPWQHNE